MTGGILEAHRGSVTLLQFARLQPAFSLPTSAWQSWGPMGDGGRLAGEAAASRKAQAASWRRVENGSGHNRPRCDGVKELYVRVCAPVSVEMEKGRRQG